MALFVVVASAGVARADTPQSGSDTAYAGSGNQSGAWSLTQRRIGLAVDPGSGMSNSRCMDAMLDWGTLSGHYDSRVVRSCRRGTGEETDPGGDGYWVEPVDWGGRTVTGIHKGFGYVINDSNLHIVSSERFSNTGTGGLDASAPGTGTQGWARVRTRYQNGSVKSCNPLPVYLSSGSGGCS